MVATEYRDIQILHLQMDEQFGVVRTACGIELTRKYQDDRQLLIIKNHYTDIYATSNKEAVTCKNCQRTRAFELDIGAKKELKIMIVGSVNDVGEMYPALEVTDENGGESIQSALDKIGWRSKAKITIEEVK